MRYAQIRDIDIANGPGVRVSLYVQGCHRHCPNCFNQETWDFQGGYEFTKEKEDELIQLLNRPHITGITILGGEPLEQENRKDVLNLVKNIREKSDKSIWLYSSFLYEEIKEFDEDIINYLDVLIDGPFAEELKDIKLKFKGSSNQRIIDVQQSIKNKDVVIHKFDKIG